MSSANIKGEVGEAMLVEPKAQLIGGRKHIAFYTLCDICLVRQLMF